MAANDGGAGGVTANDAARDAAERMGVDLSGEMPYEHFFYFEDEAGARGAGDELLADGFGVETFPPDDGVGEWTIIATRRESLDAEQFDALDVQLSVLAARHGGEYDGWGTPL